MGLSWLFLVIFDKLGNAANLIIKMDILLLSLELKPRITGEDDDRSSGLVRYFPEGFIKGEALPLEAIENDQIISFGAGFFQSRRITKSIVYVWMFRTNAGKKPLDSTMPDKLIINV